MDDGEAFFQSILAESKQAESLERAGYIALPENQQKQMLQTVTNTLANSKVFLSDLNTPAPAPAQDKGKVRDMQFPAARQSLIRFWELADIAAQTEWSAFTWKRLSDTFTNLKVFDTIDPGDIKQGSLGDCYFLSTLSALAERPERIERLFTTKDFAPNGQYKLTMMEMGHWKEYVIDDYMPMKGDRELAFSGPRIEKGVVEMWVLLLEKAWAKKYGCYYDIQAGFTEESLTDLTGAPCEIVDRDRPDCWQRVKEADERQFIITAGCVGHGGAAAEGDSYANSGLIIDHAYAVISAKEITVAGQVVKLLKIRNPWGRFEWSGSWSDNSPLWTEEAKRQVDFSSAADGTFWMCFEDFQKYFESFTVCLVHDNFWTQSLAMDQTKTEEFSVVEVNVSTPTELFFMTCQVDERRFGGIEGGYMYAPCRIVAVKLLANGKFEFVTCKASVCTRDTWAYMNLSPGKYLVYVEFAWKSTATDLFGVSVYCQNPVALVDVTSQYPDYLERCFPLSYLETCTLAVSADLGNFRYRTYKLAGKAADNSPLPGFYFDLFENRARDQKLLLSIKHTPWDNMEVVHVPGSEHGIFQVDLPPNSSRVIIKKQKQLQDKHGFKVFLKKVFLPAS